MLKKPSVIINETATKTRREYACLIYQSLQQPHNETRFFDRSFENEQYAQVYENQIRQRLNHMISCTTAEECILLPPLFLRASQNAIVQVSPQLLFVLCANGPVFPVIWFRKKNDPTANQAITQQVAETHPPLAQQAPPSLAQQAPPSLAQQAPPSLAQQTPPSLAQQATENPTLVAQNQTQVDATNVIQVMQVQDMKTPLADSIKQETSIPHMVMSQEEEFKLLKDITKTPLACGSTLRFQQRHPLTATEQHLRCEEMQQVVSMLRSQCEIHESLLLREQIRAASKRGLEKSLSRKRAYLQEHMKLVMEEKAKLTEALQINELSRRLVDDGDMTPEEIEQISQEWSHLKHCVDILEQCCKTVSA